MIVKIPEITINAFEAFGDADLEARNGAESQAVNDAWTAVYRMVESGAAKLAYWDARGTSDSFTRYALHKSTRRAGTLQRSVMWVRNGEIIPLSHSEHDGPDRGFMATVAGYDGTVVNLRR